MTLFTRLTTFVNTCMASHDPSHNPAHVHRVVSLARSILRAERARHPTRLYDADVVDLAALLHDVGDRKYLPQVMEIVASSSSSSSSSPSTGGDSAGGNGDGIRPDELVLQAMVSHGAEPELARRVQTIVSHVSYSKEKKDPEAVRRLLDEEEGYAELAIVQDADRLDALGAVGIGRCFTFLGAQGRQFIPAGGEWEMGNAIEHFQEKLERLEGMMKTQSGREMARVRTQRLVEFRGWWEDEMALASEI
ncbi:HD superfamily hydrolase [Aspergillus steynii IBT 23096]|uniref:HD superfamily hydrolase n=1 Tax=Aspergillus steynii IBT 23096 TaxID=1392250 RepID=A0A2I2FX06_9EURO|nr:HD superfamily hydrolase [Aspergillus steynii IBT 23096]PLB45170.1 HD superfamily hydrolase [Aspergillus steynii IBT 23096]